jgi:superoxide dismutase, Cu-Zn family
MKRVLSVFVVVVGVVALGSLGMFAQGNVKVDLKDAKGASVGTATISAAKAGGVSIALNVKGLPPGEHGIHIHATPSCEGANFAGAGGHFNPTNKKHGTQNPEGHHAGDMANFTVKADGTAKATVTDKDVTLGAGANSITANGAALVIHAKADDMKTDPSGNSGDRIACGVIAKK